MNSHAEANYDSTASSPSPETEVLGKAGNTPVAGSTSNKLPQVSLPTDSAQGQPRSPADLVSEVMTDLMANDTFHEKVMAMITLLYLYRKYWKNAETAVELPGLSSWSIFLYSYSLIIILIICKGGRGTRGCILTGQCTSTMSQEQRNWLHPWFTKLLILRTSACWIAARRTVGPSTNCM